jgi:hypothetical protein
MGVDLDHGDRPAPLIGGEDGNRNGIVAAQHHRHGAGVQHGSYGGGDRRAVRRPICRIKPQIAAVDKAAVIRPRQHQAAEVEIELGQLLGEKLGALANGGAARRVAGDARLIG